jgi:hypothetical protein
MQAGWRGGGARAATDPKAAALAHKLVEVMEVLYFSPVRYLKLLA